MKIDVRWVSGASKPACEVLLGKFDENNEVQLVLRLFVYVVDCGLVRWYRNGVHNTSNRKLNYIS